MPTTPHSSTFPTQTRSPMAAQGGCTLPPNVGTVERIGSIGAGSLLLLAALAPNKWTRLLASLSGAAFIYRGATGQCYTYRALGIDTTEHRPGTAVPAGEGVKVEEEFVVRRPAQQLYDFWRNLENLPAVMEHLQKVETIDQQRSRWTARGPLGMELTWDAEIINERPGEMIAWRSLPGGDVETAGSIHFKPLDEQSTAVVVSMKYNPPAGKLGDRAAGMLGGDLRQQLRNDLRNFQRIMESTSTSPAATPLG